MRWRFNDGTTAEIGGNIAGESDFARELRAALADSPLVMLVPMPGEATPLDPGNAAHFDRWLWQQMNAPYRRALQLEMIERPKDIPTIPVAEAGRAGPDVAF